MNKFKNIGIVFILILLTIWFQSWVLSKDNFFIFDDFSHFAKSISASKFTFLPSQVYNDRPIGTIFINLLLFLFGTNHQAHHTTLLWLHISSSILLYIYLLKFTNNRYVAFLSSIIFANWPRSLMAIRWDSAVFDTLGLCLSLIFLNFSQLKLNKFLKTGLLLSTLLIMLRTKESTLFVSFIPFIQILIFEKLKQRKLLKIEIVAPILLSVCYLGYLFYLGNMGGFTHFPIDNPYHTVMNPLVWGRNIFRYIYMYININESGFSFTSFRKIPFFVTIVSIIVVTFYSLKNKFILFLSITVGLLFLPVLPMVNMQHELYLYMPSVFVSTIFVYLIQKIFPNYLKVFTFIVLLLLIYSNFFNRTVQNEKRWWLDNGAKNLITYNSLENVLLGRSKENTVVIQNINNDNNIFLYGPGHVLNYYLKDSKIKTLTTKDSYPIEISSGQCLIDYNDGILKDKGCK